MNHTIIGAGGIGRWLTLGLAPTLTSDDRLVIVDGDEYEPRNHARQGATQGGKAAGMARQVSGYRCVVEAVPAFVVAANAKDRTTSVVLVSDIIGEGDHVWLCVDNHATRKAVINHCATLQNIRLVSGGCDDDEGNVIVYERAGGVDLTPHPYLRHPELKKAKAFKVPTPAEHQASCAARTAAGDGQTIRANMMAAVCMLGADSSVWEVYFHSNAVRVRTLYKSRFLPET